MESVDLKDSAEGIDTGKQPILPSTRWDNIPDLVMIDGGKGHLSAVQNVFLDLGIQQESIPLASIAKKLEEIFVPGSLEPIILPKNSATLHLVQRIRDEAHRFAINYHRGLRSRALRESLLDRIAGIGPTRKRALFNKFKTVAQMREASVNELTGIPGITATIAREIQNLAK